MPTVEQTVRELRREIINAIGDQTPLPDGASWVADRVTLSLAVHLQPAGDPGRFTVAVDPTAESHRITVEFRITSSDHVTPRIHPQQPASPMDERIAVKPVHVALAEVFGAPGFDSSARATVFREALEELSTLQRHQVLTSLEGPATPDEDAVVTRARHRILRLVGSGPAGREQGSALLRQLALRESTQALIQQAAEHWRTPSDWASGLATTP